MPFNYEEYQQKCNTLSTEQLHREWENYTRQIAGGATSTATSVLFSPVTGGISLIGLGLSAPRIHNARKKREIIEAGLQARGATHNTRKRDVVAPMAIAGTISGLTLGLAGAGADIIAGEAVGKGAEYAISHAALDGSGALLEHKHDEHLKIKADQKMTIHQQSTQSVQGQMQVMPVQPQMISYQVQTSLPGTQILYPTIQPPQPFLGLQSMQHQQTQPLPQDHKYVYTTVPVQQQPVYQPASHQQSISQPLGQTQSSTSPIPPLYQTIQSPATQSGMPRSISIATNSTETSYPPEKTAAFTTQVQHGNYSEFQYPAGCPTPLPLYTQLDTSRAQSAADERAQKLLPQAEVGNVAVAEPVTTVALSMEDEVMFLKAKLVQKEIEKRECPPPPVPASESQTQQSQNSGPEGVTSLVDHASNQVTEPPAAGYQQHPSHSVAIALTTQNRYPPPSISPTPLVGSQQYITGNPTPPSTGTQFYQPPPPPPRFSYSQSNVHSQTQQPQAHPAISTTPQPAYQSPQTQHQAYLPHSHTPQPPQQQMYPQPPKSPQPQFHRNDRGYASMASTPMPQYQSQQQFNSQQQYNPQHHIVSFQSTGNSMLSPQITGQSQTYGHGRTASYGSISQPSSMPAPPPYFASPPGQQIENGNGKVYFGQRVSTPAPPAAQNIHQPAPMQSHQPQGAQGWQWGVPGVPVQVQGQPDYGPPPAVPQAYR